MGLTDCAHLHIGTYDAAASQACADIDASEQWLKNGGLPRLVEAATQASTLAMTGNAVLDYAAIDDHKFRLHEALP